MWLKEDRTCNFFDLQSGDQVALRKKTVPKKFQLADETTKTVLVDESLTVNELVDIVLGEHMQITNPEEFSIQLAGAGADDWLNPTKTLPEQDVPEEAVLVIDKKFWFND